MAYRRAAGRRVGRHRGAGGGKLHMVGAAYHSGVHGGKRGRGRRGLHKRM